MPEKEQGCLTCSDTDKSTANKSRLGETEPMGQQERRAFVLQVLEESGVALKSVDVFRNCKLRGATFERRTTKNYLSDLVESGDVIKVDSYALDDGEIVEIETGDVGHFMAGTIAERYRGND